MPETLVINTLSIKSKISADYSATFSFEVKKWNLMRF